LEGVFLAFVVVYPVLLFLLRQRNRSFFGSFYIALGFLLGLGLTLYSFAQGAPLQWILFEFLGSTGISVLTLALKLDPLSGIIASSVLFIGAIIERFSVRYLEDDPEQGRFQKTLALSLSSILLMLLSPNLVQFFLAWVASSFFLHQLLTHFEDRKEAIAAATQKFWISRIGDVFVVLASLILFKVFKTFDFAPIFKLAQSASVLEQNSTLLHFAGIFLVLGAMAKSAQVPFHFWLPKTMETPTPVSALMHAGILNAGGYFVIRMSPFLNTIPTSLILLTLVGGGTAIYAMLLMMTQTNVKKNLAYSTTAQMGFMMFQCGVGAYALATLHIVAHSFYKAYAFLSSPSATDYGRLNRYLPKKKIVYRLWAQFFALLVSASIVLGSALYWGLSFEENLGTYSLLLILSLALAQIFLASENWKQSLGTILYVWSLYGLLGALFSYLLRGVVPEGPSFNFVEVVVVGGVTSLFLIPYLIQNNIHRIHESSWGQRLYVKIYTRS